jgi:toxin ParE1/3/4
MSLALRFLPSVAEDVLDAFAWYESNADGLGDEFLRIFYAATHALPRQPRLYREVHGAIRRCLLARFPYAVYYRLTEAEVLVLALFHCARDPLTVRKTIKRRKG